MMGTERFCATFEDTIVGTSSKISHKSLFLRKN